MSKYHKIIFTFVFIAEIIFFLRGPKAIGILALIFTTITFYILSEKNKVLKELVINDSILQKRKDRLDKEILLLKKSSKKTEQSKIYFENIKKMELTTYLLLEKHIFIKENYGLERGKKSLEEIDTKLKNLEINLKKINNSLLEIYASDIKNDKNLILDLNYIIDELDATIELEEIHR